MHHTWLIDRDVRHLGYDIMYGSPENKNILVKYLHLDVFGIFYFFGHSQGVIDPADYGKKILVDYYNKDNNEGWLTWDEVRAIVPPTAVYDVVFINACAATYHNHWAQAFHIDTSADGWDKQALVGPDTLVPESGWGASYSGQRFWDYLADHPAATVYDAIWYPSNEPEMSNWWSYRPPYGEWFTPTEPYWRFRP